MSLDAITDSEQEIEQTEDPRERAERARHAFSLYKKLSSSAIREETNESIELAARLIHRYLSPMHSDWIVDNYNTWLSLSAVKNGQLDPSTVEEKLKIGIDREIFTSEELEEAKKSYATARANAKKKPAGKSTTQLLIKY